MHDYSEFRDPIGDNLMAQINETALEQKRAEAEVARLEEELKAAQRVLLDISQVRLPALMDAAGMTKITTVDGVQVSVREIIRGGIKSGNEPLAFKWLEEQGHGDLIERQFRIDFNKGEEAWARKFEADLRKRKREVRLEISRGVHASTLQAFVREQLEKGEDVPLDTLGVYRQRITKIDLKD